MTPEEQSSEPQNIASFKTWLVEHGAYIHPHVQFHPGTRDMALLLGNVHMDKKSLTAILSILRLQCDRWTRCPGRHYSGVYPIFPCDHPRDLENVPVTAFSMP